jgi:hypothetical protein
MGQFIDKGGSVLIMLGEGGEAKFGTNINFLLEEYGIMINSDAVCRSASIHTPFTLALHRGRLPKSGRPSGEVWSWALACMEMNAAQCCSVDCCWS